MKGCVLKVRRSREITHFLTLEVGVSDPDKLKEKRVEFWPERSKRTPRRACVTIPKGSAGMLRLEAVGYEPKDSYLPKDTVVGIVVAFPQGWFRVQRGTEGRRGVDLFLLEDLSPSVQGMTDCPASVTYDPEALAEIEMEKERDQLVQRNRRLGTMEELT